MSQSPQVSIIMPVYNAAQTLIAAIGSVQRQTCPNWELIIIDDGSSDSSLALAKQMADQDSRIHLRRQSNAGPSRARNQGLALARGHFIAFLDADDLWHPDRLVGLLGVFAEAPKVGVLFSRTRFFDSESGRLGVETPHIPRLGSAQLLAENPVCSTSNIMCRRAVIDSLGGFLSGLDFAEDQEWLLRVALHGHWQIKGVDQTWFYYRSSANSQSSDLDAMESGWLSLLDHVRATSPCGLRTNLGPVAGRFYRQLARRALRMRAPRRALHYMAIALSRDPLLPLRAPKRTCLTGLCALAACLPFPALKELASQ